MEEWALKSTINQARSAKQLKGVLKQYLLGLRTQNSYHC